MKKIILMLTAVMSLGMASLGFASPASDLLAQEEVTTTKVINLIQGKGSWPMQPPASLRNCRRTSTQLL